MSAELVRVISPLSTNPANLILSNVPEDDYPAWAPGTYPKDTWVMHNHRVWQALKETSMEPGLTTSAEDWIDGGATNRWKMFDDRVGTQTVREGGITVSIEHDDFVSALYILNVWANAVRVTMTDPFEGVVYEREIQTLDDGAEDWWDYFFTPISRVSDVVLDDLPPYAGVTITVEIIVAEGQEARVGSLGMGSLFEIGWLKWGGTSVSIRDWSIKEQDDFGNFFVQERDFSKRPEFDLSIETERVDTVLEALTKLRAVPCVYIGHSKFTSTIAIGFYRELTIVLSNPSFCDATLTIEATT